MKPLILIRGGGDLATGVAVRLHRAGLPVLVTELRQPLAVRRLVCAAEAVFAGSIEIEGVLARRIDRAEGTFEVLRSGNLPVLVDPEAACLRTLQPLVVVDGRMRKSAPEVGREIAELVIGLGPAFVAGDTCHAFVETNRGHYMGRVFWEGAAQPDTGVPEPVAGIDVDRVLRSPGRGTMHGLVPLGTVVRAGERLFRVEGATVAAPFVGAVRGLLHDGLAVEAGMKVGDLDPRADPRFCREISDKSLAVGGGVLEAILSRPDLGRRLLG